MPVKKTKTEKKSQPKTVGLTLAQELQALDRKDRNFRRDLDPELQKKVSPYLMMRYSASVEGSADLQAYYLLAANENVNKNFFDISKHPELQWLTCTTASPGLGSQRHYWLGTQKKTDSEKNQSALRKQVLEIYPNWKHDELELFMNLNSEQDLKIWLKGHGVEL